MAVVRSGSAVRWVGREGKRGVGGEGRRGGGKGGEEWGEKTKAGRIGGIENYSNHNLEPRSLPSLYFCTFKPSSLFNIGRVRVRDYSNQK